MSLYRYFKSSLPIGPASIKDAKEAVKEVSSKSAGVYECQLASFSGESLHGNEAAFQCSKLELLFDFIQNFLHIKITRYTGTWQKLSHESLSSFIESVNYMKAPIVLAYGLSKSA